MTFVSNKYKKWKDSRFQKIFDLQTQENLTSQASNPTFQDITKING